MHQIVGTILCRLRPPVSLRELALFRYQKTPLLCGKSHYFHRISCMNALLPPPGNKGPNVTRNGGPQIGACLIRADILWCSKIIAYDSQDTFDHAKRQKSAISGRRLHWIFWKLLQSICFPFLQVLCVFFVRKSPQSVGKHGPDFRAEKKV